ncbi:Plexin-A4, partial [Geodia barretti]
MLALHNCSLHTDCLKCVEASEVCGWCVHDRICTGNPTSCRHEEDWRTIDEDGVCPVVNTPDRGSYTLPVSVRRELILSTFNIPPEVWTKHIVLLCFTRGALRPSLTELDLYFCVPSLQ